MTPSGRQVLVLSCGGTIASTPDGTGGVTPALTADDLVDAVPGLAALAELRTRRYGAVASSSMTLDDVVGLYRVISAWADDAGTDALGVVVTQGTDTLEEIAFGLDLLWDRDLPLVVTGAMRHPGLPGPDGAANLYGAVATAVTAGARGAGVLVVAADRIHLAGQVRKTHTAEIATFASPTLGPVGYVVEGTARVVLRRVRPAPLPVPAVALAERPVALVTMSLGDDGRLLPAVAAAGYRGVVVEALGGGHVPAGVVPAVQALAERVPVVLASRTGAGETLRSTYGFPGSERDVLSRGLIAAGTLTAPRARVLLTLLLALGADRAAVASAFATHGGYGGVDVRR